MNPWKIATAGLGAGWLLTILAFTVLGGPETTSADEPSSDATVATARSDGAGAQRPAMGGPMRFNDRADDDDAGGAAAPSGDTSWMADPSAPLPPEVMERAQRQLRGVWDERRQERQDEVREAIDTFAEDEGLDAATTDRLHTALDGFTERMESLRDDMRSGEGDRESMRATFRESRMALQEELEDILGREGADRLREAVPMGPGRPMGTAGRPGGRPGLPPGGGF